MKPASAVETTARDLGYALRSLRARPGFTLVAALSLALGIGANTAIFSLIDALLLRRLPVRDPETLVALGDPSRVGSLSQGSVRTDIFSYRLYRELREQSRSFVGLLASGRTGRLAVGAPGGAENETARGRLVSGNYFSVLGVEPARGRLLSPEDEGAPGASPYVVISHEYWRRRFAGDPGIVGRSLRLNGTPFTVVGIAPPGFFGEIVGTATDLFIPVTMQAQINPGHASLERWDTSWLMLLGRLRPGATLARVQAEVDVLLARILASHVGPELPREILPEPDDMHVAVSPGGGGFSRLRPQLAQSLFTLMAIVGAVLLIACANVANLLLERATGRRKEIGVRLALGAGRGRLVRQLLTESLLLAVLGGALGVLFAFWAAPVLIRLLAGGSTSVGLDLRPDLRLLAFTGAVSLATGLLFGLAPALRATRGELAPVLQQSARSVAGEGSGARWPLGKLLVVAQFALSLLLLVGAGLFARTLINLERLDLGYERDGLLLANVDPAGGGYEGERLAAFAPRLLAHLAALPGVEGVTISENGIFSGTESGTVMRPEGAPPDSEGVEVAYDRVGPRYFEVVGIPLRGREFGPQDRAGAPRVAIVNRALAEKYFPGRDPIGRHIAVMGTPETTYEIVGVAGDARDHELRGPVAPRLYQPFLEVADSISQYNVEIRTARPAAMVEPVRRALREIDPALPRVEPRPLADMIGDSLAEERMIARLSAVFGLVALALASIGLYGVISYAIARRTAEIGVRMALGADRRKVVGMILRETLLLAAAGIAIGVPATLAAVRVVASRLFGLSAADPATLAAAILLLLAVAAVAGAVPGSRAARIRPTQALRAE